MVNMIKMLQLDINRNYNCSQGHRVAGKESVNNIRVVSDSGGEQCCVNLETLKTGFFLAP